jgi:hypothetical protein
LVVGIDEYDEKSIPRLGGAAADAIAAVIWLRGLGVPDRQIKLHAAPNTKVEPALKALGLSYEVASLSAVWKSIQFLKKNSGDRLFVFLSGHGIYEPTKGRLFLTQDASPDAMTNLGIDLYIAYLLSLDYSSQFLVMDGCLNYPYSPTRRMSIDAALYPGVAPPMPKPENSLVALFAASQGEQVPEIHERGAYLRHFFEQAAPSAPNADAVVLDFTTGRKCVTARRLHRLIADRATRDAADLKPPITLNPGFMPFGRAGSLDDVVLFELPTEATSTIRVTTRPPEAAADISWLRLHCRTPPFWHRRLPMPPDTKVLTPIANVVPKGLRVQLDVEMRPGSRWPTPAESIVCETDVDREIPIDLQSLAYRGRPAPGGEERVAIVAIDQTGDVIGGRIPDAVYSEIQREVTQTRVGNEPVGIQVNESGPYLTFPVSGTAARNLVSTVVDRILLATDPDIGIAIVVQNPAPDTTALMFDMSAASPAQLAGPLADLRTVRLTPPGQPRTVSWRTPIKPGAPDPRERSLSELSNYPFMPVPSGPLQVALDLPWGSWSQTIDVPKDEVRVVKLPAAVGVPPLRVRLAAGWPPGSGMAGLGNTPNKASLHDPSRGKERQLSIERIGPDRWAVHLPEWNKQPSGQRIIRLAWPDGREVRVPAALNRRLGIETSVSGVRVEPLSKSEQPLWDLLATAGRLDALNDEEAQELSYAKWEDPVLGVAAAYALETRHSKLMPTVIDNLKRLQTEMKRLPVNVFDVRLIEANHAFATTGTLETATEVITELAAAAAVPVFRWGIPMARLLAARVEQTPKIREWDTMLARIEEGLSLTSVWTAWGESP